MTWDTELSRVALLASFFMLTPLVATAALVMWVRGVAPDFKAHRWAESALSMGGALLTTGLSIECVIYGAVRWDAASWLGEIYHLVLVPKLIYTLGTILVLSVLAPAEQRGRRVVELLLLAAAFWALGFALAAPST